MKNIIKKIILTVLIPVMIYAQTSGSISGHVTDKTNGGPLPAVNLMLMGTVLGTSTDANGNFEMQKIPPGTYQIRVTMMGYKRIDQKNVIVKANQTTSINFELEETIIETPEVLITANKRRQSIQDATNSVGVMTAREMKQKNEIYLDKVLENVSGVNFIGSQINIRGSSGYNYGAGSRVLFLVDGVPVMPGDSGDIKWDLIPVTQIEQVEIIKGAGSALYGASAMGGVINIITKKGTVKPVTNLRMSSGIYDQPRFEEWKWTDRTLHFDDINIDHSRRMGKSDVSFSVGRQQSTGYRQNGDYQRINASAKVHTIINGQHNFTISSNFEGGKRGAGLMWRSQRQALEVAPEAVGDLIRSDKFGLNAFHNWIANKNFKLKTRLSYFQNFWKNYFHDSDNASTSKRTGFEVQGDYQFSDNNSITFGTEESWDHVNSGLVGDHDQYAIAFYVQNERNLLPTVILTLGLRYDYQDVDIGFTDSELSPKIGMVWHAQPFITFRGSSGRGFRAASMSERFSDSIYSGIRLVPNESLKSETAWSHELAMNLHPSPFIFIDIAGFWSDYWDLIEPEPDETQTVQFINVTRARIKGIETHVKYMPWFIKGLNFDIGYTYMDPQDLDINDVLAYRSRHIVNTSILWQLGFMEAGLDYIFVDRLENVKVYPNDERVSQKTMNARLGFRYGSYSIFLNGNNILNHSHTQMERTLLPIRNYVISVSTSF